MPLQSPSSVLEALREHQLLETGRLDRLPALLAQYPDPRSLGRELIDRGWLTAFQANQIVQGNAGSLVLGSYILLDRLGEGGAGQVFKAQHRHMKRLVALKVIRSDLLTDGEVVARFYREIQGASQVAHPNVVQAYDAGPAGATHLLAMEFVEGRTLAETVSESGALPVEQACDYIRQAALGLQHIHECGLVHRDIKPANLLVSAGPAAGGVVKILDLGLARLQPTGGDSSAPGGPLSADGTMTMGTTDFMAPEQAIDFHGVDIRADIYSLGCTFYFLLTGQPPFAGGTLAQRLMRHQYEEPPPVEHSRADVPADVRAILRKMLAKQPPDRYQTPAEVAAAIAGVLPRGDTVPMAVPVARPVPPSRRWPVIAAALCLLVGLAVLIKLFWPGAGQATAQGKSTTLVPTAPTLPGPAPHPPPTPAVVPAAANERIVTTRDGNGAEGNIARDRADEKLGPGEGLSIKSASNARRKAYLRFDLSKLDRKKTLDATLVLTGFHMQAGRQEVNVFALKKNDPGERWSEADLTWSNAPGNVDNGGGAFLPGKQNTGGVDQNRTIFLGTFTVEKTRPDGDVFNFTSPKLVELAKTEGSRLVTLILTAVDSNNKEDIGFAGKQNGIYPPPTLKIKVAH